MSVAFFSATPITLERLDTILSVNELSVELTFAGKGYVRIGPAKWIYLQKLTNLVFSILLSNPHFSEQERAAAKRLSEKLKAYYSTVSESRERISRIAKVIGSCFGVEHPSSMQFFIRNEIDQLTRYYTQEQWLAKYPDRNLPPSLSEIGYDFQPLYSPPPSSSSKDNLAGLDSKCLDISANECF